MRTAVSTTRIVLLACSAALAACGGSGGGSSPTPSPPPAAPVASVSGAIQKGPFIVGSTVTINALTVTGANTARTTVTQTTDNLGHFVFTEDAGTAVQISSTGFYRNEITGAVSNSSITLRAIYGVTAASRQTAFVNVLTHATSNRVLELMGKNQLPVAAAIDQAETEFLLAFSSVVPNAAENDFSSISIYSDQNTSGSPYLLAVSAIVYRYAMDRSFANATSADAQLSVFLNELAADFAGDGDVDMPLAQVRASTAKIDPDRVTANVMAWLAGAPNQVPLDINRYLDTDLDGLFNDVDPDDDNDGIDDARDPAHYRPNDPVFLTGTPPSKARADSMYSFTPWVENNDHLLLTFAGTNVPAWATIDSQTGKLAGTPNNSHVGTYTGISITATSIAGTTSVGPFSIEVTSNPYTAVRDLPTPRHAPAVVADGGDIYAIDGFTGGNNAVVERYEVATNTWRPIATNGVLRTQGATAHVLNGIVYLVGGENASGEIATVEAYSIAGERLECREPDEHLAQQPRRVRARRQASTAARATSTGRCSG